jgi:hypothetical protein
MPASFSLRVHHHHHHHHHHRRRHFFLLVVSQVLERIAGEGGSTPNLVSYNTLLTAYTNAGDMAGAQV